ncbi:hypothetical protein MOX02_24840 [Methylobacterium oxalidis]|uniref:Uncharacterized protein n=2 Tax=Methylobacterium oxalidis TaxID=944322 RepID=A0A512J3B2_9HYPH|nr:hypothetical protein MOX02_24840 [Methylobacterium oxalidis]GLS62818.1 hypothetical protein GCM10007888_11990 [Methylobacterium oxalidis]
MKCEILTVMNTRLHVKAQSNISRKAQEAQNWKVAVKNVGDYLSRREVRSRTGWSLTFIDKHLQRAKIGGKVLIPATELEQLIKGEKRHES